MNVSTPEERNMLVNKDDLREVIAEYTRSHYTTNSNLMADLQKRVDVAVVEIKEVKTEVIGINSRLDKLNSKVASQEAKWTKHDIDEAEKRGEDKVHKHNRANWFQIFLAFIACGFFSSGIFAAIMSWINHK